MVRLESDLDLSSVALRNLYNLRTGNRGTGNPERENSHRVIVLAKSLQGTGSPWTGTIVAGSSFNALTALKKLV